MTQSVVSNAGPLLVLAKLNQLHLLKRLYGRIYFPQAVYKETVVAGLHQGYIDARILKLFLADVNWSPTIVTVPPDIAALFLDRGEQESLALALLHQALLLIDEEQGRTAARQRGIPVRGTLGILIEAYHHGLLTVDELRFNFEQIANRDDVWISPALCHRLLAEVLHED